MSAEFDPKTAKIWTTDRFRGQIVMNSQSKSLLCKTIIQLNRVSNNLTISTDRI